MSAIHLAARDGNIDEIKRLIAAGADLEEPDEQRRTPLMAACLSPSAGPEVIRLLIDHGADVNAQYCATDAALHEIPPAEWPECEDPELRDLLEQSRRIMEESRERMARFGEERSSVLCLAVEGSEPGKLQVLVEHGADVTFRSASGYTVMIHAACAGRVDLIGYLATSGAPLDGETAYGESALSVLSRMGLYDGVRLLLDLGADPAPLGWSAVHRAVAFGETSEVTRLIDEGADPEQRDAWHRTAFLLAVHLGRIGIAGILLDRGAHRDARGRCGKAATHYPVERDDAAMLNWLIERGFPTDPADDFESTPIMEAVERSASACFDVLIRAGADWGRRDKFGDPLIRKASDRAIIQRLIDLGQDAGALDKEALRDWIGLGTRDELPVGEPEYMAGRFRRFGTANPERMNVPFWNAMVRNGWNAWQAAQQFGDSSYGRDNPVWCHDRFGMSLTPLPDGRFVQIAGEHEDSYDPDFCIYNDVIIHDGKGGFEILGYPKDVFPPTDFHSATLAGDWIYVIGNLGYRETREAFGYETPVFRFHIPDGRIERVPASGPSPGWIHKHDARLEAGRIVVSGGEVYSVSQGGEPSIDAFTGRFALDLSTSRWTRL